MRREYYSDSIVNFLNLSVEEIFGEIAMNSMFADDITTKNSWFEEINILKKSLILFNGHIYFEYSIPRMGRRIDVLLLIKNVLFILEFKVGESKFHQHAIDQTWDYALDLKNFHSASHNCFIAPILIATNAKIGLTTICIDFQEDKVIRPIKSNSELLEEVIRKVLLIADGEIINQIEWDAGRYLPTPTIIEAAKALYSGHSVANITKSGADSVNLSSTTDAISEIIDYSKVNNLKSICFVTGVPGAGKTLVGLSIATKYIDSNLKTHSVYLSGNGPLVAVLQEALARDKVELEKSKGQRITKSEAKRSVKSFIQNVHLFRDNYIRDKHSPIDHVTLFDEAQRAWNKSQTSSFMKNKKKILDFEFSEPEFLISCMDRHPDWAVIVCLVGGGQEIHKGEAGISEWIYSLLRSFPNWQIYISPQMKDKEYNSAEVLKLLKESKNVFYREELHLSVSMRSFRAEYVSLFVKQLLDIEIINAKATLELLKGKYPIVITREINKAKKWLKEKARGNERFGIIVSSQAIRLKPYAIDVKSPVDPIHYFLNEKDDIRSSYFLEDVATEFHIQGLELDWTCVVWDADLRFINGEWMNYSFKGNKWENINKYERRLYQINSYRVLLTRARQGMVIVVPTGDIEDDSRNPTFYDSNYGYLRSLGLEEI